MKVYCGWHKKYFGKEFLIKDDKKKDKIISHGLCSKCDKLFNKEIDNIKKKEGRKKWTN